MATRKNPRRKLGDTGERLAAETLATAGLKIVERNWRCTAGEIDIVAEEDAPDYTRGGEMTTWRVFIEVRTRRGDVYGTALQSITPAKQAKLRQVAAEYVQSQQWRGPWRIDAVGVQMDSSGRLIAIEHIRHAVTG
ncbi:MAG: YraN family protein [Caldilineaceae bacterium]